MNQEKDKGKTKKTTKKIMMTMTMTMIIYSVPHFSVMIYLEETEEIKEEEMKKINIDKLNPQ